MLAYAGLSRLRDIATQQSPDFSQQFLRGERLEEDGAGQAIRETEPVNYAEQGPEPDKTRYHCARYGQSFGYQCL